LLCKSCHRKEGHYYAETFEAPIMPFNRSGRPCPSCRSWSQSFIGGICSRCANKDLKNAESRFDKLSNEIADEYEEKGMSPEKAQDVGDATAAKIGRAKYGKTGMRNMQKKGMRADSKRILMPVFKEPYMKGGKLDMKRGNDGKFRRRLVVPLEKNQ